MFKGTHRVGGLLCSQLRSWSTLRNWPCGRYLRATRRAGYSRNDHDPYSGGLLWGSRQVYAGCGTRNRSVGTRVACFIQRPGSCLHRFYFWLFKRDAIADCSTAISRRFSNILDVAGPQLQEGIATARSSSQLQTSQLRCARFPSWRGMTQPCIPA
jgi:hypothetical protein